MKTKILKQEINEDLFQKLSKHISYFDKDWIKEVEGATEKEIEELENIFKVIDKNFKLPKYLYSFLKGVGRNNNELMYKYNCSNFSIKEMIIYNTYYIDNLCLGENKNINNIILATGYLSCNIIIIDLKTGNILDIQGDFDYGLEPDNILKCIIENKDIEQFKNIIKDKESLEEEYDFWQEVIDKKKEEGIYEQFKDELIKNNFYTPSQNDIKLLANNLEEFLFKLVYEKYKNPEVSNYFKNKKLKNKDNIFYK